MSRIDEIQARAQAATPGPWRKDVQDARPMPHYHIRHEGVGWPIASMGNYHSGVSNGNWKNDIEFITHAREDIPWLLDENERLAREIKDIGKICAERHDEISHLTAQVEVLEAERDAAVTDIHKHCHTCKNLDTERNGCGKYSPISEIEIIRRCCNETKEGWEWRRMEEHNG